MEESKMSLKSRLFALGGSLIILSVIVLAFFGGRFYESEIAAPPTTIPAPTTTTTSTTTTTTSTTTTIPGIEVDRLGPPLFVEDYVVTGLDTELLKFRFGPGTEWPILSEFPNETPLTITGRTAFDANNDIWYEVDNQGTLGWVFSEYAAPASVEELEVPEG